MTKRKRSEKFATYLVTGVFACILIALGSLLITMTLPAQANYDTQSLATAQHLEQHPAQVPAFIRVNENCESETLQCFWIVPYDINGQSINPQDYQSLTIRINGHIQTDSLPTLIDSALYVDLDLAEFGSGLHLIDINIQDNNGLIHQHTWSVRIDVGETAPPPTLAVPPTYSTAIPITDN